VSKTSLYRLFESKDALIAAFAAEQDRLFWARWIALKNSTPMIRALR
jgi:AcrR family transcriptional regulator